MHKTIRLDDNLCEAIDGIQVAQHRKSWSETAAHLLAVGVAAQSQRLCACNQGIIGYYRGSAMHCHCREGIELEMDWIAKQLQIFADDSEISQHTSPAKEFEQNRLQAIHDSLWTELERLIE